MAEVAVTVTFLLVDSVLSLISENGNSNKNISSEIEIIKTSMLPTLRAYLQVNSRSVLRNEIHVNKATQIRDIVHRIEDALDEFMLHFPCKFHKHRVSRYAHECYQSVKGRGHLRILHSNILVIKESVDQLRDVQDITNHPDSTLDVTAIPRTESRDDAYLHSLEEDKIVGFENQTNSLIYQLVREEQNSHMDISVVGPGGFGKSTLVRIAYERVKRHFDCSAWVPVTDSFDETVLADEMISQFQDEVNNTISPEKRGNKLLQVRNYLQNKRYLVVLDDICNKEDMNFIQRFLPKNTAGSRIVITTHRHDVVVSHEGSSSRIHDLSRGLSEDAAWELFSKNAFTASGNRCPIELADIARKILSKCGGSPFPIISVSRMLAKKSQTSQLPADWQAFYETLGSKIGTFPDRIVSKTLLRSYNDLSGPLKSCFLYLSIFPEKYPIERGRLIRLWLAEGFIEPTNGKITERSAENYLEELIERNFIHVTSRNFSGKAIIFGVNNLVHEFLINKSNEENFITRLVEVDADNSNGKPRRISIRSEAFDLSKLSSMNLSTVRSSIVFTQTETHQPNIGKFISQFKLLKVLDLQGFSLESFPEEICQLTLLRYLSLKGTKIRTIPSSIDNLVYIETLNLKQTQVKRLPMEILRLPNLKYLLVYIYEVEHYVTFETARGVHLYPEVRFLSKLLKLSLIKASDTKFIDNLGYLTKLLKLGLIDIKTVDGAKLCAVVQKMTQLSTLDVRSASDSKVLDLHYMPKPPSNLQRVYLKGRLLKFPNWISSLNSLLRVGLLWSELPNNPIPALQDLPNLIELQLVNAYVGDKFIFEVGSFRKLKMLRIEECINLTTIIIEAGAIPELQKLTLCNCKSLNSPPYGIENLAKLEEFLALDMNNEFNDALRPTSNDYWKIERIPVISSLHAARNNKWVSN